MGTSSSFIVKHEYKVSFVQLKILLITFLWIPFIICTTSKWNFISLLLWMWCKDFCWTHKLNWRILSECIFRCAGEIFLELWVYDNKLNTRNYVCIYSRTVANSVSINKAQAFSDKQFKQLSCCNCVYLMISTENVCNSNFLLSR